MLIEFHVKRYKTTILIVVCLNYVIVDEHTYYYPSHYSWFFFTHVNMPRSNYDVWSIKVLRIFLPGFLQHFYRNARIIYNCAPGKPFTPKLVSECCICTHVRMQIYYAFKYKYYTYIYIFIEICCNKSPTRPASDI